MRIGSRLLILIGALLLLGACAQANRVVDGVRSVERPNGETLYTVSWHSDLYTAQAVSHTALDRDGFVRGCFERVVVGEPLPSDCLTRDALFNETGAFSRNPLATLAISLLALAGLLYFSMRRIGAISSSEAMATASPGPTGAGTRAGQRAAPDPAVALMQSADAQKDAYAEEWEARQRLARPGRGRRYVALGLLIGIAFVIAAGLLVGFVAGGETRVRHSARDLPRRRGDLCLLADLAARDRHASRSALPAPRPVLRRRHRHALRRPAGLAAARPPDRVGRRPMVLLTPEGVPQPRALLFDLDDTIIDYTGSYERSWSEAAQLACDAIEGLALDALLPAIHDSREAFWRDPERAERGRRDLRAASTEVIGGAFEALAIDAPPALARTVAEDYRDRRDADMSLFPDATRVLAVLRGAGFRLGLVTNGTASDQRRKVDRFELTS